MPAKRAKKSKITKPKKRRAPPKKSTKSIYQKVNVNVQSGGGGGGSGGMSQPTAQHHPIPQNSQIPQSFYDKTGENVKLNNIIELLNKQEKKLNQSHTNDPFDYEYGRIPDYVNSSNSSVSSLPFEDVIQNKTGSDSGTIESDYRTMESIEPYFGSYDQIETVPQNPILNIPDDTSNKSLVDRVVDANPVEEEPFIPVVEARLPITPIKMSRQELIAQLDNYPMPRKEMNAFLKEREKRHIGNATLDGLSALVEYLEANKTGKI
jgi:hypothetical protein